MANKSILIENALKKQISKYILQDYQDVEISTLNYYLTDSINIIKYIRDKYEYLINPMEAYWLWSEYSTFMSAGWLIVSDYQLETMIEVLINKK